MTGQIVDMENKDKRKKTVSLILRLLAVAGGIYLCYPLSFYFNDLLGNGETSPQTMSRAVLCACLVFLTVLAVIAGVRALAGQPIRLTIAVICLTMAAGTGAAALSISMQEPEITAAPSTPRPTVTPPAVEILQESAENTNPESGTIFYKKYADNTVQLTVDNASSRDLFIRLRTKEAMVVLEFYVRANDTVTVNAPTGTYEYVCAIGNRWENEETYFGENTKFKKGKEYTTYRWGSEHEILFNKALTGLLEVSIYEFDR